MATKGKSQWTRMVMPNRRPMGSDQANGSFMARLAGESRCGTDRLILPTGAGACNRALGAGAAWAEEKVGRLRRLSVLGSAADVLQQEGDRRARAAPGRRSSGDDAMRLSCLLLLSA